MSYQINFEEIVSSYPVTLSDWAKVCNQLAVEKGWWDKPRSFGDIISLCHSELSEALEEERNGKPAHYLEEHERDAGTDEAMPAKPCGRHVELVDCLIRILDYLGSEDADVDALMREKMDYNSTRPYRHGNKNL